MKKNSFSKHISVDCVIFGFDEQTNKLEVLLIEQEDIVIKDKHPFHAQYALPGDLVAEEESLDAAALRVLNELTHVEGLELKQNYCFGDPMRVKHEKDQGWLDYYRSNPEARVITISYYTLVRKDMIRPLPGSFAKNVVWKNTNRLPQLAFDHNLIVKKALEDLRFSLHNEFYLKKLLPKKFTLKQIQSLYEAVLKDKFDKRNFIKKIKRDFHLKELNEKQKGEMFKPAKLYMFTK